jgi:CBS domain-containing protein
MREAAIGLSLRRNHPGGVAMRAIDVMTSEVITVGENATVPETARLLAEHGISAVPVVDRDNRVVGMVSERRFVASRRNRHRAAPLVVARNGVVDRQARR